MSGCDRCMHFRATPGHKNGLCGHPRAQKGREKVGLPACVVVFERTAGKCYEAKEK